MSKYNGEFSLRMDMELEGMRRGFIKHLIDHNNELQAHIKEKVTAATAGPAFESMLNIAVQREVDREVADAVRNAVCNWEGDYRHKIHEAARQAVDKFMKNKK